jgi:hypothetical protein
MRSLVRLGLVVVAVASSGGASASISAGKRVDVGHGLSIVVPAGWRVSHERLTPCSDPVERFSLLGPEQVLTLEERFAPARAELSPRPRTFTVRGKPTPMECCSIPGRDGWMLHFGEDNRAFYAYLYPGLGSPRTLLQSLDSLRVA